MTQQGRTPPRTPPQFIAYRSVTVAIVLFLLLSLGFGAAGYGPFSALRGLANPVSHALHLDWTQG